MNKNLGINDIFIIGGGINGVGIALDAAGRGLSVTLADQADLGSGTSSSSSKLIHGGLRYLEHYDFGLVRKALKERDILLEKAPHLIKPLEFIMPHHNNLRPAWLLQLGLWIYDHLYMKSTLPNSKRIKLNGSLAGKPLKPTFKSGFSYFDAWVDDARLVISNAIAAKQQGAEILPRHRVVSLRRCANHWEIETEHKGEIKQHKARVLINATGPWVQSVQQMIGIDNAMSVRLIKGSHIILPRLYDGEHAYILQHDDQRIVFVLPFQNNYSLIGTTDVEFDGNLNNVTCSDQEIQYLLNIVNHYFAKTISSQQIVSDYAGVRPLFASDDEPAHQLSRDYEFAIDAENPKAVLMTIYGGKITTYRLLAEEALKKLSAYLPTHKAAWTVNSKLPGSHDVQSLYKELIRDYPWIESTCLLRYCHNYGSETDNLLKGANSIADLGDHFGADLYEREVKYLIENEWAMTAEDIIWRRTKCGLTLNAEEIERLTLFLSQNVI